MFPLARTVTSLRSARLGGLIIICAGLAVLFAGAGVAGVTWLAARVVELETGWLDTLVNWLVAGLGGLAGWFMLPPLVMLIAGIFQETIIDRVERVAYPDRVRQEAPGFWSDLRHDIVFVLSALFLNILVLPLYFFGIGFFVSIALNSYLLGREFFEGVAGYHLGKPAAHRLALAHKREVYGNGFWITVMSLVPVVNLFMPIVATVWMVHVYHGLRDRERTG
ncbi:MAG: EI24 domain-containing protein [Thermodesulfobacteriota bacterium]